MKCRRVLTRASGILCAVLVLTDVLMAVIRLIALDPAVMLRQMRDCAAPEATGLPAAEYPGMADMITGYLAGRADTFQYVFKGEDGAFYQCFRENEQAHMADCRALVAKTLPIFFIALCGAAVCLVAGLNMQRGLNRESGKPARAIFWRGFLVGVICAAACFTVLAVWAAVDFESLFTAFHRAAFSNELWLLKPRESLLIRLMPTRFFIRCGVIGGGVFVGSEILAALVAVFFRRRIEGNTHGV